jgi:hypothetical protein
VQFHSEDQGRVAGNLVGEGKKNFIPRSGKALSVGLAKDCGREHGRGNSTGLGSPGRVDSPGDGEDLHACFAGDLNEAAPPVQRLESNDHVRCRLVAARRVETGQGVDLDARADGESLEGFATLDGRDHTGEFGGQLVAFAACDAKLVFEFHDAPTEAIVFTRGRGTSPDCAPGEHHRYQHQSKALHEGSVDRSGTIATGFSGGGEHVRGGRSSRRRKRGQEKNAGARSPGVGMHTV